MAKKAAIDRVDRVYWTEGEGLVQVKQWIKDGLFDKQIAKNIGITPKTMCEWKKRYSTFASIFEVGRGITGIEIVNALYKSAKGYYVQEQTIDNKGRKRVVRKWIAGNVSAQIFLAKNWLPDEYKDKRDFGVEGAVPVVISGDDKLED